MPRAFCWVLLSCLAAFWPRRRRPTTSSAPSSAPAASSFQGSVTRGEASAQTIDLSLDDAIQRGLQANLGIILSGTQTAAARAERLSQLQSLLPSVDFTAKEAEMQTDLPAEGLRIPGIPTIIGPFGFTDVRASLNWSLVNVASLRNYLAARHNFAAAQLSAEDARDLVVLTVGNAYLLVLADETEVSSVEAQVATAKVSLDQAVANHQAGTAPLLDELRARVDYQSLEQQLIAAQNALEKDKLALARTIGLPLAQSFNLTDKAPYAPFDQLDADAVDPAGQGESQRSGGAGGANRGGRRAAQSGYSRAAAHRRGRRRLRRHRRHAGPLARHRGCDGLVERAGL